MFQQWNCSTGLHCSSMTNCDMHEMSLLSVCTNKELNMFQQWNCSTGLYCSSMTNCDMHEMSLLSACTNKELNMFQQWNCSTGLYCSSMTNCDMREMSLLSSSCINKALSTFSYIMFLCLFVYFIYTLKQLILYGFSVYIDTFKLWRCSPEILL
jgi:hypothetical protein